MYNYSSTKLTLKSYLKVSISPDNTLSLSQTPISSTTLQLVSGGVLDNSAVDAEATAARAALTAWKIRLSTIMMVEYFESSWVLHQCQSVPDRPSLNTKTKIKL